MIFVLGILRDRVDPNGSHFEIIASIPGLSDKKWSYA
jgi:hypothetical protein